MATQASLDKVQQFYVAYYGRPADPTGQEAWADLLDANGGDLTNIIDAFGTSPEAEERFGGQTSAETIETLYQQLFGRAVESQDVLDAWVFQLENNPDVTLQSIAVDLLTAALNDDKTVIDNKTAVANNFTAALDTQEEIDAYVGTAAIAAGNAVLNAVDATTDTDAVDVATPIQQLVDDAGVTPVPDATFTLTTGDDTIVGTADQDVIDGYSAVNSLQTDDVILDSTTGDNDRMDVTVTTNSVDARIQNIETINVKGQFINTGLALTNVSGAETLTLSTEIVGGVATVTDANSLNVQTIAAGTNVATLNVTSLSSGTRDTVTIDGGDASTISITGNAGGADTYAVTAADDATVNLSTVGANDAITLNASGNDLTLDSLAALEDLTINTTGDLDLAVTSALAADTVVNAAGDVVISGLNGVFHNQGITKTGAGSVTLSITNNAAGSNYSGAVVDTVELAAGLNGTVTVNENSVVNLDGAPAAGSTIDLDNADGDLAAGAGTLLLNVSQNTGNLAITAGDNVGTVLLTATPDEVTDTDSDENGTVDTQITVDELDMGNNAETVVVQGAEDLEISTWTNGTDNVLSASAMTGDLTVGAIAASATVVGGQGDDSITAGTAGQTYTIRAGAGDDTVNLSAADTAAEVDGDAGNDTLTGGSAADSLDGGAGDDTINGGDGADTIVTGAGADTVIVASGEAGDTITDFTAGTDTLVLTGAGQDVDLSDLTPSTGAYDFDGTGNFTTTLQGSTATDVTDSVQLGSAAAAYSIVADTASTVVAGAKDDFIRAGNAANVQTITTGAGSDVVAVAASTGVVVDDFTIGSDKVILEGTVTADASIDLTATTPASGVYTFATSHAVELSNGGNGLTETDLSAMVQLGSSTTTTLDVRAATGAVSVTGGQFNDFIKIADDTAAATVNFVDNGGVDYVELAQGDNANNILAFDAITGITDTTGVLVTANAAKTSDATDGTVYVFADSTDGAGSSEITTFTVDENNGVTAETILTDVAAFLDANLGAGDGETYVAVINDGGTAGDAYAYLINGDADGIDADDITLIGNITTFDNAVITLNNI